MPAVKRPRRGSLAYWPRCRAARIYPKLETVPSDKLKVLGFAGYKVGMTQCILVDNRKGAQTFGQEVAKPVTVLECPPLKVLGFRLYGKTVKGLKALTEVWTKELPKQIDRKIVPGEFNTEEMLKGAEGAIKGASTIRLIVSTQPKSTGVGKKTQEVFEVEVGGKDAGEKLGYAKGLLGKDVKVSDIFKEGELIDTIAVTKGKGMQGPVKRFGVRIQDRHAKKKFRHVGAIGAQVPRKVKHTVAMAGQMGFQTRTEYNKKVIRIGSDAKELNPSSGFTGYGLVKSDFVLVEGSVQGARKRLVMLRHPVRPYNVVPSTLKEIIR